MISIALTGCLSSLYYGISLIHAERALNGASFFQPATFIDIYIPFLPAWIWIYLSYFPYCFSLIAIVSWTRRRLALYATAFAGQYLVGGLFFYLLPSRMSLPAVDDLDIHTQMILMFRQIDPGFNIFPSMHVANVILVMGGAWFSRYKLRTVVYGWGSLIILSTIFVKQHYFVDIPAGIVLGLLSLVIVRSDYRNTQQGVDK